MKQENWREAECPQCGYLSSTGRKFCPACGFRMPAHPNLTLVWIGVLLLIAAIVASWIDN